MKRIVIKIGTSTITDSDGMLDMQFIHHVVDQVYELRKRGMEVCIISSGAVACGRVLFKKYHDQEALTSQMLATRGQPLLMHTWSESFDHYGIHTFQYLLTQSNLEHPALPLRNCMQIGVPIINFNDGVSTEELQLVKKDADNDDIAACVARLVEADMTIFLTQADGVLDAQKKTIETIHTAKKKRTIANHGISHGGTGGMVAKVTFAQEIVNHRGSVFIVNGRTEDVLLRVVDGEHIGTRVIK